jgi:transposase
MLTQRKELNFEGQNIYIGIDVHLKSWTVSILTETISHKRFTLPPQPEVLAHYLNEKFPGASYHSAYEAGFCGFGAHYQLLELGINNIVINPADVPTTQKEQYHKSDPVDSYKIARSLRARELTPIHVLGTETLEERSLVRTRSMLVKDMTRFKLRIKSFLYFYGISYPIEFSKTQNHWTLRFLKWIKEDVVMQCPSGKDSLLALVAEVENQRKILLDINRKIRDLSHTKKYGKSVQLIQSVPGIGIVNAMTFLTEIEDINRFKTTDHLASFVGLIPKYHSSGEKEITGEITFRGLSCLKQVLVESSWIAARIDPALSLAFHTYIKRMPPNKAIIRIARKLLNRIYYVLKNDRIYVSGIVK